MCGKRERVMDVLSQEQPAGCKLSGGPTDQRLSVLSVRRAWCAVCTVHSCYKEGEVWYETMSTCQFRFILQHFNCVTLI